MPVTNMQKSDLKTPPMTDSIREEWRIAVANALLLPSSRMIISSQAVLAINAMLGKPREPKEIRVVIEGVGGQWYPATPENRDRAEVWLEALAEGLGHGAVRIEER